jgi:hypothetical protein
MPRLLNERESDFPALQLLDRRNADVPNLHENALEQTEAETWIIARTFGGVVEIEESSSILSCRILDFF